VATNRLALLQQMLRQEPNNTFARYGLAMEYANSGALEQAVAEFETLIRQDGDYAAAYFHAGQALEKLGRVDQARSIYEKGVEVTTRKGDVHTRAEIQAALDVLPES
jgi:tetratricopeptide (TPR) repeat protein